MALSSQEKKSHRCVISITLEAGTQTTLMAKKTEGEAHSTEIGLYPPAATD